MNENKEKELLGERNDSQISSKSCIENNKRIKIRLSKKLN